MPSADRSKVHLCFDCGQKNRIPIGREAKAKCGGCGSLLYARPHQRERASASPQKPPERAEETKRHPKIAVGIVIVLIAGLFFGAYYYDVAHKPSSASSDLPGRGTEYEQSHLLSEQPSAADEGIEDYSTKPQEFAAPELPLISGVIRNLRPGAETATFRVETPYGGGYYLKLIDVDSAEEVFVLLVQGGVPYETQVPLGRYKVKYATGATWYGEHHLFGPKDTDYYQTSETFEFYHVGNYAMGQEIILKKMLNGNLRTSKISAGNF